MTAQVFNANIHTADNQAKRSWTYTLRLSFREAIYTSVMYMKLSDQQQKLG